MGLNNIVIFEITKTYQKHKFKLIEVVVVTKLKNKMIIELGLSLLVYFYMNKEIMTIIKNITQQ